MSSVPTPLSYFKLQVLGGGDVIVLGGSSLVASVNPRELVDVKRVGRPQLKAADDPPQPFTATLLIVNM